MQRYIVGVKKGKIVGAPTECIFGANEEDIEILAYKECRGIISTDIGTIEELMSNHKELTLEDFSD